MLITRYLLLIDRVIIDSNIDNSSWNSSHLCVSLLTTNIIMELFISWKDRDGYIYEGFTNLNQWEARKQCFLASDWLKFLTPPQNTFLFSLFENNNFMIIWNTIGIKIRNITFLFLLLSNLFSPKSTNNGRCRNC